VKEYGTKTFGELNAERYDAMYEDVMVKETSDSVETLAELAGGGKVLELAIGTGRVALPLAARGLNVHGIEASEAMVAKLREKPGGVFVVETVVPDLSGFVDGQRMKGSWARMDSARFEIAIHDPVLQTVEFQRIVISEGGTQISPHFMRYAWPSELDLMAQLAGLKRKERWAWWDRSPFTAGSKSHVTVYAHAAA
jgi:SAM-dependent methyltransferase